MKSIISIDINIKDGITNMCALVLFDGSIESIITVPVDYTSKDFMDVVISESNKYMDTDIIFDRNGLGGMFEDYFTTYKTTNTYGLGISEISQLPTIFIKAKDSLLELAMDSIFDSLTKVEFKKLVKEINNLEIASSTNGQIKLKMIDESFGKTRAICYLQYYYKFVANKSL